VSSKATSTWKIVVITSSVTAFFCLIIIWGAFQQFSAPTLLKYTGFAESFLLADPNAFTDKHDLYELGVMVKNGTLLSVDDVWGLQSSFYTSIITVLIATNGILAVFAFIFVRASSQDKAIDAAENYTKNYIASIEFTHKVDQKLEIIKSDYNSSVQDMFDNFDERLAPQQREINELRNYLAILTKRFAEMDYSDQEGRELEIRK
jgi:uncharacterized coiled-coil protein SlyX